MQIRFQIFGQRTQALFRDHEVIVNYDILHAIHAKNKIINCEFSKE